MENIIFNGKPCCKCGSRERYIRSKRCVTCKQEWSRNSWINKQDALIANQEVLTFISEVN